MNKVHLIKNISSILLFLSLSTLASSVISGKQLNNNISLNTETHTDTISKNVSANPKKRIIDKLWNFLKEQSFNKEEPALTAKKLNKEEPALTAKKANKKANKKTNKKLNKKENNAQKPLVKKNSNNIKSSCTVELKIENTIAAITLDVLHQAIRSVRQNNCSSLLLLINTPGGQLLTTRKIVNEILNVEFPVLCLIHPAGAHAGSAGAIIMQACHVNGAIETTNLGAATPILSGDKDGLKGDLRKKIINDTTSWLNSLTDLRKRNKKFGEEIVTKAKALSAKEAFKQKAIDFIGHNKRDFLNFAQGRIVVVQGGEKHTVQVGDIIPFPLGIRYAFLSLITEPEFTYLLFTGSLFLLYYEITHPGLGAPGLIGVMGLVISFIGMHKLDFSWAGLLLLLLSIGLFLAEVFISGFGIFGVAGVGSFILGSFLLFDPTKTGGVDIPHSTTWTVSALFALLMGIVTYLAWTTVRLNKKNNKTNTPFNSINTQGTVLETDMKGTSGRIFVSGENWKFKSTIPVKINDNVKILCYKNLTLIVEPIEKKEI